MAGGMCGRGAMCSRRVCVVGACMAGGMHGRGACMARGHVWKGHAWQGGMHCSGHAWQGGHVWQERQPLQQTVRILLECILVDYMLIEGCSKWERGLSHHDVRRKVSRCCTQG